MDGWDQFLIFLAVGALAQIVDGALGMAYGLVSTTVLLAFGVPPAAASASVHAAEVFTTAASAASHVGHKNINKRLFVPIAAGGIIGGVMGAYVLTGIDGDIIKPVIVGYLALMGCYILYRAWRNAPPRHVTRRLAAPVGVVGGFLDAVGGGGWGPTVTSTMVGAGLPPRQAIGTVNTAEFFVTLTISATFVWALLSGHWQDAGHLQDHAMAVAGLIAGGLCTAPFAGYVTKCVPHRVLMWAVGGLIIVLAGVQLIRLMA